MYNWLVFLHVFFALTFMLAHGVHAAAMLALRAEKDPERSRTLFNNVPELHMVRILMVLLGLSGLAAAFITGWWRQGWVWASAVVFLVISFAMYKYGAGYFNMMTDAQVHAIEAKENNTDMETSLIKFEEARTSPHPIAVSIIGLAGLAIILWLMRFKPF